MTAIRPAAERRASDTAVPRVLRQRLLAPITAVLVAVTVACTALDVAGVTLPYAVQVVPFAVSLLLFGLPHGALDHLVPARTDPRISVLRSVLAVVGLYALLGGTTAAVWIAAPAAGFVLFIAVTWFHWGQGDLWLDRALDGSRPSRLDAVLTVAVRGALPMLLPLIAHPHDYAAVFRATTGLLRPDGPVGPTTIATAPVRIALAALLLALIAAQLLVRHRLDEPTRTTASETLVLVAFFAAVPPVLAVGVYFTLWHAVRHIIRLELLDPVARAALQHGRLLQPFLRFLRDALPITACAIGLLAALALTLHHAGLGTYLLLIAALTTPHTAVVIWMDRHLARVQRPHPALTTKSGTDKSATEVVR